MNLAAGHGHAPISLSQISGASFYSPAAEDQRVWERRKIWLNIPLLCEASAISAAVCFPSHH
jgi:hypothetical protein